MFDLELNTVLSFLEGSKAILIMGYDGIVVESVSKEDDQDFHDLTIELGQIVKNIGELSKNSNVGQFNEMVLQFDQAKILLRSIHQDYFLALLMNKEESIGKGQFAVQRILPDLVKNL
jgi:predicted regulator of Ras-like GTPase activity (Roadblock/LC7/MglB family)